MSIPMANASAMTTSSPAWTSAAHIMPATAWAPTTSTSSSADDQEDRAMPSLMPPSIQPLTRRAAISALALVGFAPAARAADAVDQLGIPGPVVFDGRSYALAWSQHPTPIYYKQEYLPAGENLDSYSRMLII